MSIRIVDYASFSKELSNMAIVQLFPRTHLHGLGRLAGYCRPEIEVLAFLTYTTHPYGADSTLHLFPSSILSIPDLVNEARYSCKN